MQLPKYQKYLLSSSVIILVIFLILSCVLHLDLKIILFCIVVIFFSAVMVLRFNKIYRKILNKNIYPDNDWYRIHLERNFDCIVLGEKSINFQYIKEEKIFDLTLPGQTMKWDFMVLKQYFSILRPHGKVVFVIDASNIWKGWNDVKDLRPYYICLRPYVFTNSKIRQLYIKIARRLPVVMFRISDLLDTKRNLRDFLDNEEKTIQLMHDIVEFCSVREIVPFVSLIGKVDSRIETAILQTEIKIMR